MLVILCLIYSKIKWSVLNSGEKLFRFNSKVKKNFKKPRTLRDSNYDTVN